MNIACRREIAASVLSKVFNIGQNAHILIKHVFTSAESLLATMTGLPRFWTLTPRSISSRTQSKMFPENWNKVSTEVVRIFIYLIMHIKLKPNCFSGVFVIYNMYLMIKQIILIYFQYLVEDPRLGWEAVCCSDEQFPGLVEHIFCQQRPVIVLYVHTVVCKSYNSALFSRHSPMKFSRQSPDWTDLNILKQNNVDKYYVVFNLTDT